MKRRRPQPYDTPIASETPTDQSFETVVLPHLDAAYRLARWLMGSEHDAEDVVQEATLRALRYFRTFTGGNARAWFLTIVRNTCWALRNRSPQPADSFDEQQHSVPHPGDDPEMLVLQFDDVRLIERAMKNLPDRVRTLLVLRELEGLSYRELADVMGVPIGTIMSGLSRARQLLRQALFKELNPSGSPMTAQARERQADGILV